MVMWWFWASSWKEWNVNSLKWIKLTLFGVTPEEASIRQNLDSEDFHLEAVYRHWTCWSLDIFGVSSHRDVYCNLEMVFLLTHECFISYWEAKAFICVHVVTWWGAVKCTINSINKDVYLRLKWLKRLKIFNLRVSCLHTFHANVLGVSFVIVC